MPEADPDQGMLETIGIRLLRKEINRRYGGKMPRRSTIVRKQLVEVTSGEADPDQRMLDTIGTRLYGNSWQSALARDLGLSRRSIERWRFGMFRIAPERWEEIRALLHKKRGDLMELEHELANYLVRRD